MPVGRSLIDIQPASRAVRRTAPLVALCLAAIVAAGCALSTAREAHPLPPPSGPAPVPFSAAAGPVILSRVYAHAARDNEFVELASLAPRPVDLAGWSLTDGEAIAVFPAETRLPAGGRFVVTRNATSYAEDTLEAADFAFEGVARAMEGGVLRLADTGDEVLLVDPFGTIVDAYVWGDSDYAGPGWTGRTAERTGRGEVAVRQRADMEEWFDRDIAEDWEGPRRHRLGQSAFEPEPVPLEGTITAVLSPDAGDLPLLQFLGSAQATIEVGMYTLTSERIASVLADAARRGVSVRMLLDGGPVGGIGDEERRLVGALVAADVEVRWLTGGSDVVKRYRFLHAKYALVDGRAAWIGSENFGETGFSEGRVGNRGWSVAVESPSLARSLQEVFEADFDVRRRDSVAAVPASSEALPAPPALPSRSSPGSGVAGLGHLVVGPDTSLAPDGVIGLLASARERLSIEAFYIDLNDRVEKTLPFVTAVFDAARRGVSVRILLDGSWSSIAEFGTNDDVLAILNGRARAEGLPLEVRLLRPQGPVERLHNKGVVADGRAVLVSSMNWALGAATENREIGLILEAPEVARTFEAAFDADWEGRATSGVDAWRIDDPLVLVGLYAFVAAASAVSLRKLRAGAKGIKPHTRVATRASYRAHLRGRRGEVRLLPPELVAEPGPRARGRRRPRGGREATRGRVRGPEGD